MGRKMDICNACWIITAHLIRPSWRLRLIWYRTHKALRYGGRVVPVGVSFRDRGKVKLDLSQLVLDKKSIVPFLAEPAQNFPLALSLIQSKAIDVNSVITIQLPLTHTRSCGSFIKKTHPL